MTGGIPSPHVSAISAIRRETPLLRYKVAPLSDGHVDMKRTPEFSVALGQGTPAYGEPVVPLLRRLHNYVIRDIIDPLSRFLQ